MREKKQRTTLLQKQIIWGCAFAYTLAYMTRLNLSATLSDMMRSLNLLPSQAGLLQTCFALVYALGQLVCGNVVDHQSPKRLMGIGLLGTALANILMSFCRSFGQTIVLCLLNGAFQSMLWTPIVCLISMHCPDGPVRVFANLILSITLVAGHFLAWLLSGMLNQWLGWHYSYLLPGICVLLLLYPVMRLLRHSGGETKVEQARPHAGLRSALGVFWTTGFFLMLMGCVCYGYVRDGMITWTTEILQSLHPGDASLTALFSLVLPVINLLGIFAGFYFRYHGPHNSRSTLLLMIPFSAVFCLPLLGTHALFLTAFLIALSCACLYGVNPILTGLMPMEYDRYQCVGLAAGLVDASIYAGSALSGFLGGHVYEKWHVTGLYGSWILMALICEGMILLSCTGLFAKARHRLGGEMP